MTQPARMPSLNPDTDTIWPEQIPPEFVTEQELSGYVTAAQLAAALAAFTPSPGGGTGGAKLVPVPCPGGVQPLRPTNIGPNDVCVWMMVANPSKEPGYAKDWDVHWRIAVPAA